MARAPLRKASLAVALLLLAAVMGFAWLAGSGRIMAASTAAKSGTLQAFGSDAELSSFLKRLRARQARVQETVASNDMATMDVAEPSAGVTAFAPPQAEAAPGITNNQEVGVDEGGIVKVSGQTLVILRRGRLFTVSLAGGGMRPIDSIDAFPPGVSGQGDWYDEMLLAGDRVIVVGYSYARGGTEINRFRLDPAGRLRFEDSYHLRSNDYYSSRNYASRLIGDRLIFYTPLYLGWQDDPLDSLPGLSRWRGGDSSHQRFERIASANRIYIPPGLRGRRESEITTLHSVTSCDLTAPVLDCSATGVLGPDSRDFYVSGDSVYLWISDAWSGQAEGRSARAMVYRLPLDEEEIPSAIGARGAPVDQFSFREDPSEGMLSVLVRSEGGGDAMWRPEVSEGDIALLRIPLGEFGDGSREVSPDHYRPLPRIPGESWSFHNRFVGNYILYGAYGEAAGKSGATLVAAPVGGGAVVRLRLPNAVERIEAMGGDAMVIGGGPAGLGFSAIDLGSGHEPRLGDVYVQPSAAEGETRSHAFFFSPDPGHPDGAFGTLGLPVARRADPSLERFFGSSAAMLFLRRQDRRLSPAGELAASMEGVADDGCHASCVDWYGNARPIFLRGRTFALLGYELVEGRLAGARIREVGRISFAPRGARSAASGIDPPASIIID